MAGSRIQTARHRLAQTRVALLGATAPASPIDALPNQAVLDLFNSLSAHDRRHLIAVYERACQDELAADTCLAGLLHDIGKVSLSGRQVHIHERILHVLPIGRHPKHCPRVSGIDLTRHHAAIGAARLRALGVSERVCWLVEHHADLFTADPQLQALQIIDNATL